MDILIAFPVKNCLGYTKRAFTSLKTSHPNSIMVLDDFSDDGTKEWLDTLQEEFTNKVYPNLENTKEIITVIDPPVEALSARWNLAMEKTKELGYDSALICNNDIVFSPHTIDALIERMQKAIDENENVAMVTAMNQRGTITPERTLFLKKPNPDEVTEAESPDFSCFLLRVSAWEQIGHFDENYIPCYFEDNDTHTMLKIHDLRAICTTAAPYYHFGSKTQNQVKGGVCTSTRFDKNRQYFIEKFGMDPSAIDVEELRKKFL
jgi:GT2 family glycosyltransferase